MLRQKRDAGEDRVRLCGALSGQTPLAQLLQLRHHGQVLPLALVVGGVRRAPRARKQAHGTRVAGAVENVGGELRGRVGNRLARQHARHVCVPATAAAATTTARDLLSDGQLLPPMKQRVHHVDEMAAAEVAGVAAHFVVRGGAHLPRSPVDGLRKQPVLRQLPPQHGGGLLARRGLSQELRHQKQQLLRHPRPRVRHGTC